MQNKLIKSIFLITSSLLFNVAQAFDCSVIYDEFDSLMHKDFLKNPENYVPAVSSELSYNDFKASQEGKFHLRKDRPDRGLAVVYSNDKLYGKFVFHWPQPQQLIIEDIIFFTRIEDGYAPFHLGPVNVTTDQLIDLDQAMIYSTSEEDEKESIRADLALSASAFNPVLSSINESRVYFPTASLCQ